MKREPAIAGRAQLTPGEDVPNPFVVVEDGRYLLFASQKGIFEHNLPVRSGPSLDRLGSPEDAFPDLPDWVQRGFTWAFLRGKQGIIPIYNMNLVIAADQYIAAVEISVT